MLHFITSSSAKLSWRTLAWAYIVESREHKKKLPKAKSITDKLRVLLTGVQIPASLPNDLDEAMTKG